MHQQQLSDAWVVTYRLELRGRGMIIYEAYRGPKAECERIARHSAAPNTHAGHVVSAFKVITGPAQLWEDFLAENTENNTSPAMADGSH